MVRKTEIQKLETNALSFSGEFDMAEMEAEKSRMREEEERIAGHKSALRYYQEAGNVEYGASIGSIQEQFEALFNAPIDDDQFDEFTSECIVAWDSALARLDSIIKSEKERLAREKEEKERRKDEKLAKERARHEQELNEKRKSEEETERIMLEEIQRKNREALFHTLNDMDANGEFTPLSVCKAIIDGMLPKVEYYG